MPKIATKRARTAKTIRVFIQDSSSSTGAGLTGLVYNSSGLVAYYLLEGSGTPVAITLASGTAGTWSSGGFSAVSASLMPGVYELGLPNAALASGETVLVQLSGATNMVPTLAEIQLDGIDYSAGSVASVVGAVGSVTAAVTLPAAPAGYGGNTVAPDNASIAAILVKTDVATSTRLAASADPTSALGSVLTNQATIDGHVLTRLAASAYTAPPTDYQQRGIAVTLPARDFTTIIPLNSPHGSEGEALLAARAQGAGTWSRTGNVIHLLAPDKTTVLFTLTFDDITNPLLRTET